MKKYFNNIEVEVLTDIGERQCVIEFVTGMYYNQDEFEDYCEPIETRIVVFKNQLTNKPIEKRDIIIERDKIINEANYKAKEIISNAHSEKREEYNSLVREVNTLKKNRNEVNKENEYYQTALRLRDGVYKYVVYQYELLEFSDFKTKLIKDCDYEDSPRYEDLMIRICENKLSYKSGMYYDSKFVDLFETKESAMNVLQAKFQEIKEIKNISLVEKYYKYDFNIPHLEDSILKQIDIHNKNIDTYIKSHSKSIEDYKNKKFIAKDK